MPKSRADLDYWYHQTIPGIFPQTYLLIAEEHGVNSDEILLAAGIDRHCLDNPEQPMTMYQLEKLVVTILTKLPVDGLGLEVGWHLPPTAFGNVGYALLCSPTLGDAISVCQRFWPLIAKGVSLTVFDDGDYRILEVSPFDVVPNEFRYLMIEGTLTSFHRGINVLIGNMSEGGEVWFSTDEPGHVQKVHDVLGQVQFNMPANQYRVPRRLLSHPVAMSNSSGYELALAQCEREKILSGVNDDSVSQRVQAELTRPANGYPSIEAIADKLNVTPRTLRRRLMSEGTSYSNLLDACRRRDAVHFLANPGLSIQDIASLLGYSDPANFTRAFKQWTGQSPSQYRKKQYLSS